MDIDGFESKILILYLKFLGKFLFSNFIFLFEESIIKTSLKNFEFLDNVINELCRNLYLSFVGIMIDK
jgi:hypothetical protein